MNTINNVSLQGIYKWKTDIFYLAWESVSRCFLYKKLCIDTKVGSYNNMIPFFTPFSIIKKKAIPLRLGHLLPDAVPSDIYPELFI